MELEKVAELYRPMLFNIAHNIVGNIKDAEDVVQETFIKWLRVDPERIDNHKAYLIRAVTNASLNFKELIRHKIEIGLPSMPDWVPDRSQVEAMRSDIEHELAQAYQTLRERLTPSERGVYMLKELFDMDYDEISCVFEKHSASCRQLFSRAKKALTEKRDRFVLNYEEQKEGFMNFLDATQKGKMEQFIQFLKDEMESYNQQRGSNSKQ